MNIIFSLILALCSVSGTAQADIVWSTPTAISSGANASEPSVVMDSNGNVTAVWVENNIVYTSTLPTGGTWNSPTALSNLSNIASNPILGVDSSGNVTALWIENAQIESALYSATSSSWAAEVSPISG